MGSPFIVFADFRLQTVTQLEAVDELVGSKLWPYKGHPGWFLKRGMYYFLVLDSLKDLMCIVNEESR